MIKDNQTIKRQITRLYSSVRRQLMKVNEINAGIGLFNDEIGEYYTKTISRLFEELGMIIGLFEDDYSDENIFFLVEQDILFPNDNETEFSIFLYRKLFNRLLEEKENFETTPFTNALENYFLDKLLLMENSFNKTFYKLEYDKVPDIVKKEYEYFLENLHEIFQFNFILFFDEYGSLLKKLTPKGQFIDSIFDNLPSLYFIEPTKDYFSDTIPYSKERGELKQLFLSSEGWQLLYRNVYEYIHKCGYGMLSYNYYFEWDNHLKILKGYETRKNIQLQEIVGYDKQIEELVFNTLAFIEGLGANNVLIYGYRGCGKTTAIHALLSRFKERGLRLVKITKEDMDDLPQIITLLSIRKEKYIIFPDDLSYEEHDREYKRHKVILDSMLDKCPHNIIIYATSNTQDLVKFNKRFTTDDIRIDNRAGEEKKLEFLDRQFYDEKRALTDRFGLTLLFAKPDRDIYAQMLLMHAKKAGIDLSDNQTQEELIKKYETWTLYHGTPCGRSAQNFIGYITAKEKMGHLLLSE